MRLSELVKRARKKRLVFRQVVGTIEAAGTYAEEESQWADLAEQLEETQHFNTEKQADRAVQFEGLKTEFRTAREQFYTQAGPFHQSLREALVAFREASQQRIETYRAAYRARTEALDDGLVRATALYREFAPYLRNRRWLRSYWARIPLFERITWIALHVLIIFAAMLKLSQMTSWSDFLQDDLLVLWGGLWAVSLIRWGAVWGLAAYLRRRDDALYEAIRKKYKAFDLIRKQDALAQSLPPLIPDLSVLAPPPSPDDLDAEEAEA